MWAKGPTLGRAVKRRGAQLFGTGNLSCPSSSGRACIPISQPAESAACCVCARALRFELFGSAPQSDELVAGFQGVLFRLQIPYMLACSRPFVGAVRRC